MQQISNSSRILPSLFDKVAAVFAFYQSLRWSIYLFLRLWYDFAKLLPWGESDSFSQMVLIVLLHRIPYCLSFGCDIGAARAVTGFLSLPSRMLSIIIMTFNESSLVRKNSFLKQCPWWLSTHVVIVLRYFRSWFVNCRLQHEIIIVLVINQ